MSVKRAGKYQRTFDEQAMQQIDKVKDKLNVAVTQYEQLAESYLLGEVSQKARKDAFKNSQRTYAKLEKLHREYLQKQAYSSSQL
ncbi:hypothetical protein DI392_10915 [Vibrio albus]|uniref:Uncharacterized protein n=1 Tax=Vibrio albus TaxID=2200953 RepID=A0A2U3B994_9VIBR|nr:hypothetical protein [Vibrio albus]PWI33358.1 hypothetical protein DI392_10915 [Vibrio albus]